MPAEMAYALLNDIYAQMDLHLRHWFPDDQCESTHPLDLSATCLAPATCLSTYILSSANESM